MGTGSHSSTDLGRFARGLALALTILAGLVGALLLFPTVPLFLLAGMETDRAAQTLLVAFPPLLLIAVAAAILCLKRFSYLRAACAVGPVVFVLLNWGRAF